MNKKFVKLIAAIITLSLTAATFAACGGNTSGGAPSTPDSSATTNAPASDSGNAPAPAGDITISVAASASWIRDIDRELAERFTQETGIRVDLQANPDDQYESVIMTRLATGEGPDIYMGETGLSLMRFQPERYALDLSNEAWVAKYPEFMFDQAGINGVIYGFTTWGRDFRAMIYNSEIFDRFSITIPTSYDEFARACEILLENGITPVYFSGAEEWYCDMAFDGAVNIESRAPGTYARLNNQETTYSESAEALKFLRNLKDSADRGFFGDDFLAKTYDQGPPSLASGEYAMWFGWATYVNDVEAAGGPSADTFLAFPTPYTDDFSVMAMTGAGMTRMINRDSRNIEAAKAYFDFLAREDNLQDYYDGRPDLLESTLIGATAQSPKNFAFAMDLVNNRTLPSPRQAVLYQGADGSFGKNVQSMLFGLMTPEQVLESLDAARARTFENIE